MAGYGSVVGFETLAVAGTAVTLTASEFLFAQTPDANSAFISVDGTAGTNDVRYTIDGTTPVGGTTGHLLQAKQSITIRGANNLRNFKVIREGGSSSTLQVTYFL